MTDLKDILLPLNTYPDPTPDHVIDWAVRFAALCEGRISALVSVLDRKKLAKSYSHGSWLLDVPALIDEAISTSGQNSRRLVERFEKEGRARGVLQDEEYAKTSFFTSADRIVACARLRDLVLAPIPDFMGLDELMAEDLVFGTGRPVILLPAYQDAPALPESIGRIVVAWDYSRAAARAMADAMPLLQKARRVTFLTIRGEKDIPASPSWSDLNRHLGLHGVAAELDDLSIGAQPIGETICGHALQHKADMLVMGAFGHSRMREFVLGGASRSIIAKPPLPVFMSH